jgi:putative transcriptional regulator
MPWLKNHLLIASPELSDPNFRRTVTYLFEHSAEGAVGFVINRPTSTSVRELPAFDMGKAASDDWDEVIHLGGPVSGPLVTFHQNEDLGDQEVLPGVFLTATPAKMMQLVAAHEKPALFVANHAGWGPGQLESELKEDSWLVLPAEAAHFFWTGEKELWETLVGVSRFSKLAEMLGLKGIPEDPKLN